jgi:hypothetical protein
LDTISLTILALINIMIFVFPKSMYASPYPLMYYGPLSFATFVFLPNDGGYCKECCVIFNHGLSLMSSFWEHYRQFKLKMQQENKKDDARWKLLVRKVESAKAISSLSLPKRKRDDLHETSNDGIRSFRL